MLLLGPPTLVLNVSLVLWYGGTFLLSGLGVLLSKDAGDTLQSSLFFIVSFLAPALLVLLAALLNWACLAMLFNHSTLELHNGALSLRHRPFRWRGEQTISTDLIERFDLKTHTHYFRNRRRHSVTRRSTLRCHLQSGQVLSLVDNLMDQAQAEAVVEALNKFIGRVPT